MNNTYNTKPLSIEEFRRQQEEYRRVSRLRGEINKSGISDNERADLYDKFQCLQKQMNRRARAS